MLDEGYGFSRLLETWGQEAVFAQGKANNGTGSDIKNKKKALHTLAIDPPRRSGRRAGGGERGSGVDVHDMQALDLGIRWLPSGEIVLDWRRLFAQCFARGGCSVVNPMTGGKVRREILFVCKGSRSAH